MVNNQKNRLLFIVGVGRSGTSLLQSMFAANQEVCYLPETSFIRRYIANNLLSKLYASGDLIAVEEQLRNDSVLARTELDIDLLLKDLCKEGKLPESRFYHRLVTLVCDNKEGWIGDKDPRLLEFLPLVSSLAPKSQIINVIRDPRDVLLSKKKAAWSRNGYVWKHIFANRVQLKLGREKGERFFGKSYHEVIYEELIAEPEKVLRKLCQDMGLVFDEEMLDFGLAAKKLVSSDELSWKKETFGPLLTHNKGKWKDGLKPREVLLTEMLCKQAFKLGGYQFDTRTHKLSLIDRLWIWSGASIIFLVDWPYRFYRNFKVKRTCKRVT